MNKSMRNIMKVFLVSCALWLLTICLLKLPLELFPLIIPLEKNTTFIGDYEVLYGFVYMLRVYAIPVIIYQYGFRKQLNYRELAIAQFIFAAATALPYLLGMLIYRSVWGGLDIALSVIIDPLIFIIAGAISLKKYSPDNK